MDGGARSDWKPVQRVLHAFQKLAPPDARPARGYVCIISLLVHCCVICRPYGGVSERELNIFPFLFSFFFSFPLLLFPPSFYFAAFRIARALAAIVHATECKVFCTAKSLHADSPMKFQKNLQHSVVNYNGS